ncbi:MAG: phosphoribosyl-AMP cyclohydrolase [Thermomicrobiales bacterium]|nr:phosphoribosyl-AMP cyclohydrolase [Thermomicrobiales bacterium]
MSEAEPSVRWGDDGLIPVVTQDERSGDVLMVAFMNAEALAATRATGYVHYWSRSRGKLWCKGETSGNRQQVVAIFVNCDRNSLLLRVRQTGAVCHDGYPTCYYRRLEPDDSLTMVRERVFDPAEVYGVDSNNLLTDATRLLYGAYAWLRDHDLSAESGTSRRLRIEDGTIEGRVADELTELAGVLDGSHRHGAFRD